MTQEHIYSKYTTNQELKYPETKKCHSEKHCILYLVLREYMQQIKLSTAYSWKAACKCVSSLTSQNFFIYWKCKTQFFSTCN